jgi:hypothetical protein
MHTSVVLRALGVLVFTSLSCSRAAVAAQRTFVSVVGTDANTCTVAAPCRTFDRARVMVEAGGEVIVLDTGGYGAATINRAVSIIAPAGICAGVSVFGPPAPDEGILVAAGVNDRVVLRGLSINSQGVARGIRITTASDVEIADCSITGLPTWIVFQPTQMKVRLALRDTVVRGGDGTGLYAGALDNAARASTIDISRSTFRDGDAGIDVSDIRRMGISESFVLGNSSNVGTGIFVSSAAIAENPSAAIDRVEIDDNLTGVDVMGHGTAVTAVNATNSSIANNLGTGLHVGDHGYLRLAGSGVTGNDRGVAVAAGGAVASLGNNLVAGNRLPDSSAIPLSP